MIRKQWLIGMLAVLVTAAPAFAHHGGAAFDQTKVSSFSGTVTKMDWVNPHVVVYFDVKMDNGEMAHWSGWLTAPNKLARAGWSKRTLNAGDHIEISGNAQKNGSPVLQIRKLVGPDGKELPLFEQ